MTGNAEEHATLSRALSQLAEVEEKIEQLHIGQVWEPYQMGQKSILSFHHSLVLQCTLDLQDHQPNYPFWFDKFSVLLMFVV